MRVFDVFLRIVTLPAAAGLLASCETLPLSERHYISQPSMLFDGSGAARYDCNLLTQVETGRLSSGGAAGSGCSSCQ